MPDFFNYNFPVIPDNLNNNSGGSFSDVKLNGAKPKTPKSHFFTESTFSQTTTDKAFGPVSTDLFQVTSKFSGNLKAYAVTGGTLFYAQFGKYGDKINAILKPHGDIGLGLKIKYFIYRGLNFNEIFSTESGVIKKRPKNSPDLPQFLNDVWDEYTEFTGTDQNFTAAKSGYEPENSTPKSLINKFFFQSGSNLLHVKAGTHIGTFVNGFGGFEIVLDDGDYEQEKSDTALLLNENFITATETVLKVSGNHPITGNDKIFGGNSESIQTSGTSDNEKIFRENVYRFIDPAAFYGSHITDLSTDPEAGGEVILNTGSNVKKEAIFNEVVSKFKNKNKIYFYIKSERGRSYKFYKPEAEKTITLFGAQIPFNMQKWPILIKDVFSSDISLGYNNNNIVSSNILLKEVGSEARASNYCLKKISSFKLNLPIVNTNENVSHIVYLNYFDGLNVMDNLFGNINLKAIFEKEDFSHNSVSYVNHLRSVLIDDYSEVGVYNMKVILEGDLISTTNPSTTTVPSDADLAKNLRTYILFPKESSITDQHGSALNFPSVTAGYYTLEDESLYVKNIYGKGEIWNGVINDGSTPIKSLAYRSADNTATLPLYQIGISQLDYRDLTAGLNSDAVNLYFVFEGETFLNSSSLKYNLKIKYDKKDGTTAFSSSSVVVYTVDGYFFFTKEYSSKFEEKRCKEFADTAIDFLPNNISSYNYGYEECGFDFMGFEGRDKYYEIIGKYYDSTGKPKNLTDGEIITFNTIKSDYLKLLARKYNSKPTNWRTSFPFHTDSIITLYAGKSTTVKCKISSNPVSSSGKLYYKYNSKNISIDNTPASPATTDSIIAKEITSLTDHTIVIKAFQKFDQDQVIQVVDDKGKIAGKLHVLANKKIGEINILLVNCKTNITGSAGAVSKEGLPGSNLLLVKKILSNFLNQAYLTPNFEYETLDLTTASTITDFKNNHVFSGTQRIKSNKEMFKYCYDRISYAKKNSAMVLLFFNEFGSVVKSNGTIGGGVLGEANDLGGGEGARIFSGGKNNNVIAHEALHALGLYHSFDIDGEYTFSQTRDDLNLVDFPNGTDNVMDYFMDDKKRKFIWMWQMKKIYNTNNNSKIIIKE